MTSNLPGLDPAAPKDAMPKVLAFFLPQFHPIPENDEWWGTGFTEWTNVAKARPRYRGHHQPHLPTELGYYDLRVPEVREAQSSMALEHGIDAFVYYHYWFNGRRLLERPVEDLLRRRQPEMPFCIAWANENWSRVWDGGARHVLMEQEYSAQDDEAHIESLRRVLTDDRYLTVDGRPVLLVYRADRLPDPVATCDRWRRASEGWGLPGLYLLRIDTSPSSSGDPGGQGFDAAVEFQPAFHDLPPSRLRQRLVGAYGRRFRDWSSTIVEYDDLAARSISQKDRGWVRWPGLTPGFDNTARRRHNSLIVEHGSPESYERWLRDSYQRSERMRQRAGLSAGLIFVNAWNEWAEGNHLEPDARSGRSYLEVHRRLVAELRGTRADATPGTLGGP